MKQLTCSFLAVLIAHVLACATSALAGQEAEPETITIRGETYTVVPDAEMQALGFEFADVSREENAAYDYIAAMNAYRPWEGKGARHAIDAVRDGWPDDDRELRQYVAANAEALQHVRAGAAKQASHFPFIWCSPDGMPTQAEMVALVPLRIPMYAHLRELARLLSVVGAMHEHDGDLAGAMDAYLTAVTLGVHLSQDTLLVDWLVAAAIWRIGTGRVLSFAVKHETPEDVLLDAQKRLATLRALRPGQAAVIRSEAVFTRAYMAYAFRQDGAPLPEVQRRLLEADKGFWEAFEAVAGLPLPEYMRPTTAASRSGHERLQRALAQLKAAVPNAEWMALADPSGIMDYPRIRGDEDVSWTITDVFLALARWKAEHNEYPEKLEDARDLMLSDGIDPFSGEPLKYRREDDGSFTLWSFGENFKDDGGNETLVHKHWGGPDYVWSSRLESDGE